MHSLSGSKILLGVTGGIAAYKSALLLRTLQEAGAEVRVVMTEAAQAFVTPLTFASLSGHEVYTRMFDPVRESSIDHISLARWADLLVVAPATADFIARSAQGMANDLLSTICLATQAPIALAPAMNQQMWENAATQANLQRLRDRGYLVWGPDSGLQACGETGPGRMLEPTDLLEKVTDQLVNGPLRGINVLMTVGPTFEPIDPVRYVGNRSSGKMGFALAMALSGMGARVSLVCGPVALAPLPGIEQIDVNTAAEMEQAVMQRVAACDIFVAVAAVADYRPARVETNKLKKTSENLILELVRNPDILAQVAALKDGPFTVGFAAETENMEAQAESKRLGKGVDLIAANQVADVAGGFERDDNAVTLFWQGGRESLPLMPKTILAKRISERVVEQYHAATGIKNT